MPTPWILCIVASALLCNLTDSLRTSMSTNSEKVLQTALLTDYSPDTRPVLQISDALNVKVGIALTSLQKIDELLGEAEIGIWLRLYWRDPYLSWNRAEHDVDFTSFGTVDPHEQIWTPDLVLYNSKDKPLEYLESARAIVMSEESAGGSYNVVWSRPGTLKGMVGLNMADFPFDTQELVFELGSWAYSSGGISLSMDTYNKHGNETTCAAPNQGGRCQGVAQDCQVDLDHYQPHPEWQIVTTQAAVASKKFACCDQPFDSIRYTIKIVRNRSGTMQTLFLPALLIALMSPFGFWVPPAAGERLGVMITAFLTLTAYLVVIIEKIPDNLGITPFISKIMLALFCLSFITTVLGLLSILLYHRMDEAQTVHPVLIRSARVWVSFKEGLLGKNSSRRFLRVNANVVDVSRVGMSGAIIEDSRRSSRDGRISIQQESDMHRWGYMKLKKGVQEVTQATRALKAISGKNPMDIVQGSGSRDGRGASTQEIMEKIDANQNDTTERLDRLESLLTSSPRCPPPVSPREHAMPIEEPLPADKAAPNSVEGERDQQAADHEASPEVQDGSEMESDGGDAVVHVSKGGGDGTVQEERGSCCWSSRLSSKAKVEPEDPIEETQENLHLESTLECLINLIDKPDEVLNQLVDTYVPPEGWERHLVQTFLRCRTPDAPVTTHTRLELAQTLGLREEKQRRLTLQKLRQGPAATYTLLEFSASNIANLKEDFQDVSMPTLDKLKLGFETALEWANWRTPMKAQEYLDQCLASFCFFINMLVIMTVWTSSYPYGTSCEDDHIGWMAACTICVACAIQFSLASI